MGKTSLALVALLTGGFAVVFCGEVRKVAGRSSAQAAQAEAVTTSAQPSTDADSPAMPTLTTDKLPATVSAAATARASFRGNALDECAQFFLIAPVGTDPMVLDKKLKEMPIGKDTVPINTTCADQFADRTPLASCNLRKTEERDGGEFTVVVEAFYYNVKTVTDSDGYMRDCLARGGKWATAAKDDPEAARERLRQRARGLQDIANQAPR